MGELGGKRFLFFVGDDYEDLEVWYPLLRLQEAGASAVVAGEISGHTYRGKHGYPCRADVNVETVASRDFEGVIVAGGWMPDRLRRVSKVLELVREFDREGKLIASICHGPWILISAHVCRGAKMTSTPGIRDDLVNAGAEWSDAPVVVDRHFITSRRPPDLPLFCAAILAWFAGKPRAAAAR
ncbi:MAG: type 1 glutamine amidotransferase [Phycisphaerales bacterium]|nr:type 1 glutamine amidotransferase [Phycisphaerales bacterium]